MSCNDDRGQQLLDACRRIDENVPDQIAVVGVDNDEELCNLSTPSLSSVDVNAERIGFAAAELLDRMMVGKKFPGDEVLFEPSHVVARLSSDTLNVEDPSLSRALRYIRDHAVEEISVSHVVDAAMVSRRYLERLMISQIGRSPHQEILRVRIERAKQLLRDSELTLSGIAQQCGFSTAKYFGDAFQRQTGFAPGEFRRQVRDARFQDRMPQSRVARRAKRT
jgi:LacI family transcriptional regulator